MECGNRECGNRLVSPNAPKAKMGVPKWLMECGNRECGINAQKADCGMLKRLICKLPRGHIFYLTLYVFEEICYQEAYYREICYQEVVYKEACF